MTKSTSTTLNPNKSDDELSETLLEGLRNEMARFEKVMERKSITLDQIVKAISTIRELRSSLEKQTESVNQNETGVKIEYDEYEVKTGKWLLGFGPIDDGTLRVRIPKL